MVKATLLCVLFLFFFVFSPIIFPRNVYAAGTWYVSKLGNNSNGQSWTGAWNELDQIDWSVISPGDTIYIDGGGTACAPPTGVISTSHDDVNSRTDINNSTCGMRYSKALKFGKSGASGNPIKLRLGSDSGRNGTAIFFGGRTQPLPYCGQGSSYTGSNSGIPTDGIISNSQSYVSLDGAKWSGIIVYGFASHGILLNGGGNLTFRNMEIYDNGTIMTNGDPDQKGVQLQGNNITFERSLIHDNGQDAFQSGGASSNFTLRDSWLYNSRMLPDGSNFFNFCRHSDGVQIWNGGVQSGFLFERDVIGPNLMQGLLLGESSTGSYVDNVTIRDTLMYDTTNANLHSHGSEADPLTPTNWILENVTSVRDIGAQWHNIYDPYGTNLTLRNSIFYGGMNMSINTSTNTYDNNCEYQIPGGVTVGTVADPRFADMANGNFALQSGSPCAGKGSSLTSASRLLSLSDGGGPSITSSPPVSVTPTPTFIASLTFQAEQGTLVSPFTSSSTYISQTVETTVPSSGGRASYTFNAPYSGVYTIVMKVNAPTTTNNSLFVNIDSEPVTPGNIWDITPLTSGMEERTVSARGNGTESANQFVPALFTLSEGTHTLIIRGREANVQIDSIQMVSQTPSPTPTLTSAPILTFQAEQGTLVSPFGSNGAYISQSVETTVPASGGKATYAFTVPANGTYIISMKVNAPTTTSNSLFVNIDAEPSTPTMIWDILPLTSGFEDRIVSWRGTGNEITNQYVPNYFNLSAGTHTLIIRGREANVQIDSLQLIPQTSPTQSCASVADLNCDGKIDTSDLIHLLNAFFTSDSSSDLNSDGKVNAFDVVILLENWKL